MNELKKILWIAVIISSGAALAGESPAQEAADSAVSELPGFVSIFASGEGRATADSVVVSLSLRVEDTELAKAVNLGAVRKSAFAAQIKAAGIPKSDVVFENFSSDSQTGILSGRVRNYTVTSPIRVTVRTEAQFAKIAMAVDQTSELTYTGRQARVSDRTAPQLQASGDAVKNLKKKVALYESEFGVGLQLLSFEEILPGQTVAPLSVHSRGVLSANPLTAGLRSSTNTISADAIDGLIASPGSFGELNATVHLHGIYRIASTSGEARN